MAEPSVAPPTPGDASGYRPISLLAIIGLGFAGLYAGIVVLSALASLIMGGPVFLPLGLLVIPAVGAGLSWVALARIRGSEGTLAGETLARWAIWVAALAGFGYVSYYLATGYAIQWQADAFLTQPGEDTGFFPSLKEGEVNRAFLLTFPHSLRQKVNPKDETAMRTRFDQPQPKSPEGPAGMLTSFRNQDIVQLITQAEDPKVVAAGVKEWGYDKNGYFVSRNYLISTDEANLHVLVPVHSTDSDAPGEPRKWFVQWKDVKIQDNSTLTEKGQLNKMLRGSARQTLREWGQRGCPTPATGAPKDRTDWDNVTLPQDMPMLGDREQLRGDIRGLLAGSHKAPLSFRIDPGEVCPIKMVSGHVEVHIPIYLEPSPPPAPMQPTFVVFATVVVRSKDPVDLDRLIAPPEWVPYAYEVDRAVGVTPDRKEK